MTEEQSDSTTETTKPKALPATYLLFQEPDPTHVVRRPVRQEDRRPAKQVDENPEHDEDDERKPRRRGSRGRGRSTEVDQAEETTESADDAAADQAEDDQESEPQTRTRTRTRSSRSSRASDEGEANSDDTDDDDSALESSDDDELGTTTRRRRRRRSTSSDEVTALKGSTRLEAKRQRRRDGREAGRRRHSITESEFLARREAVSRKMLVREQDGLNQIAVLEDDILVEHYVARHTQVSMVGNVYLGRVQNVLPSMEAAFVDIGKGRNAVLYAGEVNWEAAGLEGKPRRIESALKSGESVLVQVTKDPIGHKGARLTAQITLAGRHLVLVPSGAMTGISRKLPDRERQRLKKLLKEIVPPEHGVIVRTAAEGATEDQLRKDVERLTRKWDDIQAKIKSAKSAPALLKGEPELAVRVVRDVFNEDFESLYIQGKNTYATIKEYVHELSPELDDRVHKWVENKDIFTDARVDEQLSKAMDRKVYLPSGGSLVIDRTEAMTVVDVNTGRFTGSGGTLEETVTKNNLEAAEEIVRQLRLRDIGGIIVIDFIDMVLESNRDLVLRRLIECLGRDRTRHQVAEVTSLGLVQMTRKRVGQGLVEAFSSTCEHCEGRGYNIHTHAVEKGEPTPKSKPAKQPPAPAPAAAPSPAADDDPAKREEVKTALASIAAAAAQLHRDENPEEAPKQTRRSRGPRGSRGDSSNRSNQSEKSRDVVDSAPESTPEPVRRDVEKPVQTGRITPVQAQTAPVQHAEQKPAVQPQERKSRRVASSGTIVTGSSGPAIIVAEKPAKKPVQAPAKAQPKVEKTQPEPKPVDETRKKRRVASSGTIIPASGSTPAIMSFPVK
ncbi:Rne/Rng family ribonuclease [Flaviflexus equikiangi]|nr:Rne/Rng family ribonuclease [Flaviflexus equikiangi]